MLVNLGQRPEHMTFISYSPKETIDGEASFRDLRSDYPGFPPVRVYRRDTWHHFSEKPLLEGVLFILVDRIQDNVIALELAIAFNLAPEYVSVSSKI